jgi:hypothetical protein
VSVGEFEEDEIESAGVGWKARDGRSERIAQTGEGNERICAQLILGGCADEG